VVPRIAARLRSQREHLRHLAIVFKFELRLKIVAELYIRAMSPKGFFDEFGGGSVERVAQHFEVLEEYDWLRRVGYKDRDTERRGPSEILYRATEVAFFDAETWALLPYSLRLAYSWSSFTAIARLLRQGIEGAFFEARPSRALTCRPLELDEISWTRVIARLDADFESIFEEQEDARIRCACAGEELIRAGILQTGFESPRADDRLALCLADGSFEPPIPLPERMAPIFADELCMQILSELNRSDMSVKHFHREFADKEASEGVVRYRFGRLKDLAWITVVDRVRKRAAYENIYRATKPAVVTAGAWTGAPLALRVTEIWKTFVRFSDLVKEAIIAGTFDLRDDRHLSWSIVNLDREGWQKITARMEALAMFTGEEERRAKQRIAAGAKPLTMVVGLMAVESRGDFVKVP
jgi:hypothetical protein